MKNVTKLAISALFGFALLTSTVEAGNINKGQKIYSKKIKGQCEDKTGAQFAKAFKQKEWEAQFLG